MCVRREEGIDMTWKRMEHIPRLGTENKKEPSVARNLHWPVELVSRNREADCGSASAPVQTTSKRSSLRLRALTVVFVQAEPATERDSLADSVHAPQRLPELSNVQTQTSPYATHHTNDCSKSASA